MKIKFLSKNPLTGGIILNVLAMIIIAAPASSEVTQSAVIAMAAGDYSSGAHAVVSVDPVGGPRTLQEDMVPSGSDLTIVAHGDYFYRMEQSGANNITKFDINDPGTPIWQFSTEGSEINSNPHDMVFVSDTKAYLLRYGSPIMWVVNPSATTEDEFKTGEIDLSAYADSDGIPDMHSGVVVDGLLYVAMQRVDFSGGYYNIVYNTPWVAVYDTTDDSEVDTGQESGALLGIPLPMENPGTIQYIKANNTIYVQGTGQYTTQYTSGIATIDPSTYEAELILDDGDETNHPYGAISGMVIVSPTKGYFIGYEEWGNNTLYCFDPSAKNPVGTAIPGLEQMSIGGTETGAYIDKNNMLWICAATYDPDTWSLIDPQVIILNTQDDTVDETIAAKMNPLKVVFTGEGTATGEGDDDDSNNNCFISSAGSGSSLSGLLFLFVVLFSSFRIYVVKMP